MKEKPTILFVSHSPGLYGAERSLLDLVTGLKDQFEALVVVPAEGPLFDAFRQHGIECIVRNHKAWIGKGFRLPRALYRVFVSLFSFLSLSKALKGRSVDLVYSNTIAKPMGALLSLRLKVPHIWHVREFVREDFGKEYDFGERLSFSLVRKTTSRMICNSRVVCEKMSRYLSANRLRVVYNGVLDGGDARPKPSRGLDYAPGRRLRLCLLGQLHEGKGQAEAIKALKILVDEGTDAELRLVGSGEEAYLMALKTLARDLAVEGRIFFEGYRANGADYLAAAHIALVCSRCEAFGRVAVEAMAVGTPVVATASGGIPEIIEDGVTGMLYAPGDSRMLAEKILRLVRNPSLYASVSAEGLEQVYRRFTRERYVTGIRAVIEEVIEENAGDRKRRLP